MKEHIRAMIEPLICLSTAHLTKDTCDGFAEGQLPYWPIFYENEYGAFVHVSPFREDYENVPTDLAAVLTFASEEGIAWVKFDPEGVTLDELPLYDWDV